MNRVLIKMCGITRPEDAVIATTAGADLIGMVFSKTSSRCVTIECAREIAASTHAQTVGVFYEQTTQEMQEILEQVSLDFAQLHSPEAIENGKNLSISKIYVIQPGNEAEKLPGFNVEKDFVLFDSSIGGSGKVLDWTKIIIPDHYRWLIAGGLNPKNVSAAIEALEPGGVDVASGIENGVKGVKDHQFIKQFIEAVRHAETRRAL